MAGQDFSLRVRNITPFDAQVKLLYTGDDDPNFLCINVILDVQQVLQ